MKTTVDRFWEKVQKTKTCWLWKGKLRPDGYARIQFYSGEKQRQVQAHRFSYELHNGPIVKGLDLDHLCRVRHCVNPDHLEAVTRRENLRRGVGFAAKNALKTHCAKGHEYNSENTYTYRNSRSCLICCRARWRRYYHLHK